MDVGLNNKCLHLFFIVLLFWASGCGNRYDIGNEQGRNSRIDDANFFLSEGLCDEALDAINPLFNSAYNTDQVRIIKASAHACKAGFNFLTLASNLSGASDVFAALAKTMTTSSSISSIYDATDVLTFGGTITSASGRSKDINTYMVFVQMGVIGEVLRKYGNPSSTGGQQTALAYTADGNSANDTLSNLDACALESAFAIISDSYSNSSLSDSDSAAVVTKINAACASLGGSCASGNKDRTACTGAAANSASVQAAAVVTQVNTDWL